MCPLLADSVGSYGNVNWYIPKGWIFPRDKAPYIYMYTVNILKGGLSEKWEGFATCVNQTFLEG